MSKLTQIRLALSKLIVGFTKVETDNGVLEYEGEVIEVGTEVYVTDENGQVSPAADGKYVIDEYTYVVADGKVSEIIKAEEAPVEEVPVEEVPAEANKEEEPKKCEDEMPIEVPIEDVPAEELDPEEVKIIETIDALGVVIKELTARIINIESKLGKVQEMSMAKPAEVEIKDAEKVDDDRVSKAAKILSSRL